jgi:hypothetical protein
MKRDPNATDPDPTLPAVPSAAGESRAAPPVDDDPELTEIIAAFKNVKPRPPAAIPETLAYSNGRDFAAYETTAMPVRAHAFDERRQLALVELGKLANSTPVPDAPRARDVPTFVLPRKARPWPKAWLVAGTTSVAVLVVGVGVWCWSLSGVASPAPSVVLARPLLSAEPVQAMQPVLVPARPEPSPSAVTTAPSSAPAPRTVDLSQLPPASQPSVANTNTCRAHGPKSRPSARQHAADGVYIPEEP